MSKTDAEGEEYFEMFILSPLPATVSAEFFEVDYWGSTLGESQYDKKHWQKIWQCYGRGRGGGAILTTGDYDITKYAGEYFTKEQKLRALLWLMQQEVFKDTKHCAKHHVQHEVKYLAHDVESSSICRQHRAFLQNRGDIRVIKFPQRELIEGNSFFDVACEAYERGWVDMRCPYEIGSLHRHAAYPIRDNNIVITEPTWVRGFGP